MSDRQNIGNLFKVADWDDDNNTFYGLAGLNEALTESYDVDDFPVSDRVKRYIQLPDIVLTSFGEEYETNLKASAIDDLLECAKYLLKSDDIDNVIDSLVRMKIEEHEKAS